MLRILGIAFYLILAFLILGFIFVNRDPATLELFPLDLNIEMPLYLWLSLVFLVGLGLGLLHSAAVWAKWSTRARRSERALAQVEKEIAARTPSVP